MSINVDDTDPAIQYSGSWEVLMNSPLEFGGGVHSTTQNGASATITFVGTRIQLFCTVPMGNGTETGNWLFDGKVGVPLSRETHPSASYYHDPWFDSGVVDNGVHVFVASNGGGPNDAPLQLDVFSIDGSVVSPTPTASSSPHDVQLLPTHGGITSSAPSATITSHTVNSPVDDQTVAVFRSSSHVSDTPSASASASDRTSSQSGTSDTSLFISTAVIAGPQSTPVQSASTGISITPANASKDPQHALSTRDSVGPIIGGVLGTLFIIVFVGFLVLCRRRIARRFLVGLDAERGQFNSRDLTAAIPFILNTRNASVPDIGLGSRKMEQPAAKLTPLGYMVSLPSQGSETLSIVSNNANSADEKNPNHLTSLPTKCPLPSYPFLIPDVLEEDAEPFFPPPSYQSARNSTQ
ncbi:hypothetical protein CVT26_005728 [Gymnopilus dilepis]|uniref:Uncharacterized protein n=1 Tax=Gymnopilus dilepis TaxID=231916 RepID=A0A409VPE0_9AGAR|nr:hypothetical protein CVT26_005728 [Gymnopilus dilepis]